MTLSHAESFLKESINSHGSQLLKYAKDNYPKYGRGTLFFHFTPIGYEFECGDVIYLNINDIIQSSEL
ncbi:hypothetical protein, partial [Nostoc sp. UCD120]|uniref:hypothetical protein n=2 Tax=unclassified Nostoc TaxID=2593658 RepID=UPI00184D392B